MNDQRNSLRNNKTFIKLIVMQEIYIDWFYITKQRRCFNKYWFGIKSANLVQLNYANQLKNGRVIEITVSTVREAWQWESKMKRIISILFACFCRSCCCLNMSSTHYSIKYSFYDIFLGTPGNQPPPLATPMNVMH